MLDAAAEAGTGLWLQVERVRHCQMRVRAPSCLTAALAAWAQECQLAAVCRCVMLYCAQALGKGGCGQGSQLLHV